MSQASQYIRAKGAAPTVLTGDAVESDVVKNKTFYSNDPNNKQTGTLELTGNAVEADVLEGKTFYSNDPNTKLTGTAVFQTGHIQLLNTALEAAITINKAWNQETWVKTQTPSISKSWSIV